MGCRSLFSDGPAYSFAQRQIGDSLNGCGLKAHLSLGDREFPAERNCMHLRLVRSALVVCALNGVVLADSPVTTDTWDITQGTVILNHSSFDHEIGQGYD